MMIKIAMSNFIVRLFCWYKDNKNPRTTGECGAGGGAPFGGLTIRKSVPQTQRVGATHRL